MIVVTSRSGGTTVSLCCCLCGRRLRLTEAWLAFPVNCEAQEGRWVHRPCLNGRIRTFFAGSRAVMMNGQSALVNLAQHLTNA
jgi:hypothetical protein